MVWYRELFVVGRAVDNRVSDDLEVATLVVITTVSRVGHVDVRSTGAQSWADRHAPDVHPAVHFAPPLPA